ncbi:MAG: pyruvate kinase [Candidatus Odinarchaeota archaeon]
MDVILSLSNSLETPESIVNHPRIAGIRLNTAATFMNPPEHMIKSLKDKIFPKKLWIDLKCRELRVAEDAVVPSEVITVSHPIEVNLPVRMYFNQGKQFLIVSNIINGNQLVIKKPSRAPTDFKIKFGKGASINISDPSLKVKGFLTDKDRLFIEAAKNNGIHDYMASYVEELSDIEEILTFDPEANIIAKIESMKGLDFVHGNYEKVKEKVSLMAARGDLYIEIDRPHLILNALKLIIEKDPAAIYASRIMETVSDSTSIPACSDITDVGYGLLLGYKTFLLGDEICSNEISLKNAVGLLDQIYHDFTLI